MKTVKVLICTDNGVKFYPINNSNKDECTILSKPLYKAFDKVNKVHSNLFYNGRDIPLKLKQLYNRLYTKVMRYYIDQHCVKSLKW